MRFSTVRAAALAGLGALAFAAPAAATQINTGGENGAYFSRFCPIIQEKLATSRFEHQCVATQGSRENIQRAIANPSEVGYAQFDVYALEREMLGRENVLTTLRTDLGRECVFMVTTNREIISYGDVLANINDLRFVLPPERSGSAATFEFLQTVDPGGLGLATDVTYAESTDQAIADALADDRVITLFVQFPDPRNARFKTINEAEGAFVPVIDRAILRQQIGGEKLYFAQETEVANPKWHKLGTQLVTACTPIVMFTGSTARLEDQTEREDLEDLIKTVRAIPAEELQPKESFFRKLWNKTKELSAKSVDKVIELSDEAREKAGPALEKARERAGEMADNARQRAGELADQARDAAGDLADRARELGDRARERLEQGEGSGNN